MKIMVKYFELGLIALNWNYHYIKKYILKGSEPEGTEALRVYNAIIALRYTGKKLNKSKVISFS